MFPKGLSGIGALQERLRALSDAKTNNNGKKTR